MSEDSENKDQHYIMRTNSQENGDENEKPKSPIRQRLKWAVRGDKLPDASDQNETQNADKSPSQSHPIFLVDNQEENVGEASSDNLAAILGATSGKKQREELRAKAEEKFDFEEMLQAEREKLTLMFQNEMQEKLTELDEQLNEHWSKKYEEIQKSYENRIDQYEHLLRAAEAKEASEEGSQGQGEFISRLEKEISEKYQQQYLDKIEEIQQNFKAIEEENLAQIVEEIRVELEAQYEQRFADQVITLREEARKEIERNSEALGRSREMANNNEFEKMLEVDVKTSIEATMREKFEKEREAIIKKYSQEQAALKKEITAMENKIKEKLEVEIKEDLEKEYSRKEKLMNLNWRKKMDGYKKTLEENLEQEMKAKLENEKKEIEKAKVEINRVKSLENVRLKKAEDSKKAVEQKLKEQEEKYEKMIANLKKQIDDQKREPQYSEAETFSQPLKKNDTARTARNNSQTKSSHQPMPNNPVEERDMNSRSRREGFGESPFFTRNQGLASRSRSRSPIQENHGQRPSYMSQGELYDERDGGDKLTYSNSNVGVYNQPISTLRNRSNNLVSEEPHKVIMDILNPMGPPDLLSQENVQMIDMPLRERESVREEKRLPLLQQSEGASNYDNLKAEIMKKYSPIKRSEEMEENIPGKQGAFYNMSQVSSKMLASGLVDDFQTLDLSATGRGTGFLGSQQSIGQSAPEKGKAKEEPFAKKYEALLQKYSKEGFMKDQYKSLLSKKETSTYREASFRENAPEQVEDQYNALFEIKQQDDAKVKEMKKQKKSIETAIKKDNGLESKYIEKEVYFISDFLIKTNVETTGQQKTLKNAFKTLFDLWNNIETSYQARINFVDNLELIPEYDNLMEKINLEIDYLKVTQKNVGEIMGFVKKRNYYREQINGEGFEYKKYRKLYFAIDGNNIDMRKLLEQYRKKYNKDVLYKGIELTEMIKVDSWEHEFLQKAELKGEILERIKRKI